MQIGPLLFVVPGKVSRLGVFPRARFKVSVVDRFSRTVSIVPRSERFYFRVAAVGGNVGFRASMPGSTPRRSRTSLKAIGLSLGQSLDESSVECTRNGISESRIRRTLGEFYGGSVYSCGERQKVIARVQTGLFIPWQVVKQGPTNNPSRMKGGEKYV